MAATISRKPAAPSLDEIERFIAALPIGAENAITARKVAKSLGLLGEDATDSQIANAERKVRLLSEYAVFVGHVYCADNSGYYRPDVGELPAMEETIGRRESQAKRSLQWCQQMRANVTRSLHQGRLI